MLIRYGFEIQISVTQATPVISLLDIHDDRRRDIVRESPFVTMPAVQVSNYTDQFGNRCRRLLAPQGDFSLRLDGIINDSGKLDAIDKGAAEIPVKDLPDDVLVYLLGSRYCETDRLSEFAWKQFGAMTPGWLRVQSIVDFVHERLKFGYQHARATRTAAEAMDERVGVCRDFAHLTIALCRCLNIPARYVNGYLGDIGVPRDPAPMDFSAWCEIYLGGCWHTFDPRHDKRRVGRLVVARGRDATDVPLIHTFGQHVLKSFKVWTDEVPAAAQRSSAA
jgi:transglutaminase-like putative cysteine protease